MLRFPFFFVPLAGALSFLLCPAVRRLAVWLGAVDRPGGRHIHGAPTPRLGGLALAATLAVSLIGCRDDGGLRQGLLGGGGVLLLAGVWDDRRGLPPAAKLVLQLLASLMAVLCGLRPGDGPWSLPITLLWLVLITNALNLIDGLDGLCGGCGVYGGGLLGLLGLLAGNGTVAALGMSLAGGCLGFLPHNLRRCKLFLGDTGAQLIGFCLGLLTVRLAEVGYGLTALGVLAYPLGETVATVLRRLRNGKDPLKADRGHWHHRLTDGGCSHRQAVLLLLLPAGLMGGTALLFSLSPGAAGLTGGLTLLTTLTLWQTEGPPHTVKDPVSDR